MKQSPGIGDRLTDRSAPPDDIAIRGWIGPDAYAHWSALRDWIAAAYPGVFAPDWIFGGQKHGWALRYKKNRAFCTFLPEYRVFSVVIVLGAAEREKVEARREALSPRLMKLYDSTETYRDGKWLKIGVSSADELRDVTDLLILKRRPRSVF
ncbi:DUF3788 domain-containing protein [Martelella mediterranea]|uniref:DUF3788 domain-containing protein n=1 Tax=Martelella mediterranea TaxID=293089 RepID=UPI001E29B548|nr:DUF3788 domain-containing protein [Martelella mediterranea]MCD1634577.1 DUF3788 domain-containing protein [Martelella mediterranea]